MNSFSCHSITKGLGSVFYAGGAVVLGSGFHPEASFTLVSPVAIGLGAIPGALSRYYLTVGLMRWLGHRFPWGTFLINLSGSLGIGFFTTLLLQQVIVSVELQRFLITGFLGSYTTFSTYALDVSCLWRGGEHLKALVYWAGSIILGGLCCALGVLLGLMITKGGS
jgi:CrcB protein